MTIRILAATLAFASTAALARAEILLEENFEKYVVGSAPTGAISIGPRHNTDTLAVTVVEGTANTAGGGTGKGVRILDNDPKGTQLDYNVVATAADQKNILKVAFDIAWQGAPVGSSPEIAMNFGVGAWGDERATLSSNARRHVAASFYTTGKFRFNVGGKTKSKEFSMGAPGTRNQFVLLLNDGGASVSTSGPDGRPVTLDADSVIVYQNRKQIYRAKVEKFASGDMQMGRVGFATASGATGLDYIIDNIKVETSGE